MAGVGGSSGELSGGEEVVYLDCGTTEITPRQWHFVFRPPNSGDFNVFISVGANSFQKSYQIAVLELSVSAHMDNWQPFQLRLTSPKRRSNYFML